MSSSEEANSSRYGSALAGGSPPQHSPSTSSDFGRSEDLLFELAHEVRPFSVECAAVETAPDKS